MTTLVVGQGLLGRAVSRRLAGRGGTAVADTEVLRTVHVPWGRPADALTALTDAARDAASVDPHWSLVWTAGAGVIATRPEALAAEVELFRAFVDRIPVAPAAMFLASSAGGAYAGSPDRPPFTEESVARAASPYGHAKLAMEEAAGRLASRGTRVLIGRLSNLYGPGQDLTKPQGLVSQLCLTHVTRQPLHIYAAMDSLRDYLYVDDAAAKVVDCLDRLATEENGRIAVKILASGHSMSVGSVIGEASRAFRRRPHLVIRSAPTQIMDLRLQSATWTSVDRSHATPFPVGLVATADHIGQALFRGGLASVFSR